MSTRTTGEAKPKRQASVSPEQSITGTKSRSKSTAQEDVGRVRTPTNLAAKTRDVLSVSSERSIQEAEPIVLPIASEGTTKTDPLSTTEASVSSERSMETAKSRQGPTVPEGIGRDSATNEAKSIPTPLSRDADALILFYADLLDDAEKMRCATENRHRSLVSAEDWGKGINPLLPEITVVEGLLESVKAIETGAVKALERALKEHPLGSWVYATKGVGPKQGARFLAAIGNPADRDTVSQLWAYCGLHVLHPDQRTVDVQIPSVGVESSGDQKLNDSQGGLVAGANGAGGDSHPLFDNQNGYGVAPRRTRGQKANWSSVARSRVYVIAESCLKQKHNGPYYAVYEAGREKYADAIHHHVCRNSKRPPLRSNGCGTTEHPERGAIGSPLRPGHQHARAMRLVMKEIVKDLWVEAKARS